MAKERKRKALLVEIIPRKEGEDPLPYEIMDGLIAEHHPHLRDARIALAWRYKWKADQDDILRLAQTRRASDVDVQLHGFDYVIMLNFEAWNHGEFSRKQQEAVIDHELMHCQPVMDKDFVQRVDDTGKPLWRVRRHDVEEFTDVVQRHGMYMHQLEEFASAALDRKSRPLLANVG